jgi:diguanylate cyclase (GGDEF)-like protein
MFEYLVPVNLALFSAIFAGIYLYQRHLVYARWLAIAYVSGMFATIFDIIEPHSEIARLSASDVSHPFFWSVSIFVMLGMADRYGQRVSHGLVRTLMALGIAGQLIFGWLWYLYIVQETLSNLLAATFMLMAAQLVARGGSTAIDRRITWLLRAVAISYLLRVTVVFAPVLLSSANYLATVHLHNALQLVVSSVTGAGAALAFLVMSAQDVVEIFRARSRTDALTGLLNRRGWEEKIEALAKAGRIAGRIVLICDVDHFKRINDQWGHQVGDAVLQRIGICFAALNIQGSEIARIGGEEFAILLPQDARPNMLGLAESVRRSVETLGQPEVADVAVTCSIGYAVVEPDGGYRGAYVNADAALYAAKREGRNRVVSADSLSAMAA